MTFTKKKNECYTYFAIYGDFQVKELCDLLKIEPWESWQAESSTNKKENKESFISLNKCENYNVFTSKQMEKTIEPFWSKIELLAELKERLSLRYFLVIVPCLHIGEIVPAIAPNSKIIEFCYKTGTELDIDLYLEE